MLRVDVRAAVEGDRAQWLRMRGALWPDAVADHDAEIRGYFSARRHQWVTFVAEVDGRLVGFLELDQRTYAPGCRTSPVPFIDGWYVDREFRRRGVGRALVAAAEAWSRSAGHDEIASDVDLSNVEGKAAHRALGYSEVERIVCFRKALI